MSNLNDIEKEFKTVNLNYPTLNKLNEFDKAFCISGTLSIVDSNGWNWGDYQIEFWIPKTYPFDLPLLVETAGIIKRDRDWHISKEGICCVGTPARQFRDMADGISLIKWTKLFVIPYLANHAYKKDLKHYADGELAHDEEGILQDYASCFGFKEPIKIIQRLNHILGQQQLSLNSPCFCESGKKYKRCYLVNSKSHRLGIPIEVLKNDLKKLKTYCLIS